MKEQINRDPHKDIDHVFMELLPSYGMPERPEQIALSHRIFDVMLDGGIALCDAGTGIGKTYAYLVAGIMFLRSRFVEGKPSKPVLVSTSSIALQKAVRDEYLPFLSAVLTADGMLAEPIRSVIRKGKAHYVCDERLERRLEQLDLSKKNWKAGNALLSLRKELDLDEAVHLSGYDRERVCVPQVCNCKRNDCRYRVFLDACDANQYPFQICNHNLLVADAIHRGTGRRHILPECCAVVIDEAHKLPETARQMFAIRLCAEDFQNFIYSLRKEKYLLAAESLSDMARPLLQKLAHSYDAGKDFQEFSWLLVAPDRVLDIIQKQIASQLSVSTRRQLEKLSSTVKLFCEGNANMVFYTAEDEDGGTMLCAAVSDLTAQLQGTLWNGFQSIVLASGTLAAGGSFQHYKEAAGLTKDCRVTESISPSPFDYQRNCLLYLPKFPPSQKDSIYYDKLNEAIALLLKAACGHALVLFTSYAAMSAVKERLTQADLPWPIFTLGRNALHTTEQFKTKPGSVLLAAGAAWEGFDFPGDCVSLLVIPHLPFAQPDTLKEKLKENYPDLHSFIRAVVVPEMQVKLKQGFGRAIRTETDTCVIAVLDERAVPGGRYFRDVQTSLPAMRITKDLCDVEDFIHGVKEPAYFQDDQNN